MVDSTNRYDVPKFGYSGSTKAFIVEFNIGRKVYKVNLIIMIGFV